MNMKQETSRQRTGRIHILITGMALYLLMTAGCAHQGGAAPPVATVAAPAAMIVRPLAGEVADYVVGAGDLLEISVWKDPALTRQMVVLPDGTISFPLIGQFSAAGSTVAQLKAAMEKKLVRYIPEPDLSVIVQQVNSQVVYVIGKVNRPGHLPLNRRIDVLQALAMAGGLNVFANREDIRIFRKTADRTMVIPFNYQAVTEENRVAENIWLERGDVIVVK
ncbi:hypothetical protein DSCA_23150 [Desulfosarcina alkanivorans]|uniref:Uncharacterized protein n=2 Tax=Desulfosarcina alkanivorans TaxID=571177 RepID=A0A5K7YJ21_9BACT|nr:hypothetical protein DSCA_23150 [Desulfosarcina alkanivorans]